MEKLFGWRCETCIVRPMCTKICKLVQQDNAFISFFESIDWKEYQNQIEERSFIHMFGRIKYSERKEVCYNLDNIVS